MPDRTKGVQLASKYGGAAGYGLAAGTCRLLSDATKHNRLKSDTYKRLNVGLFFFCFISLFSIPGEAAFHPQFGPAVLLILAMSFLKGWGCSLAFEGWKTGVEESNNYDKMNWKQLAQEFGKGIKSNVRGIFHTPRKGFVYLLYLLLVLAGGFSSIMEAKFYMKYGAPLFNVSLQWSSLARLSLVSSMVYSLKDAAERGRLTGSTFIQMNFMVALWALSVAIGQGAYRHGVSFSKSPMLLMSIPFLYGGIRSLYQKSNAPPPSPKLDLSRNDSASLQAASDTLESGTLPSQTDSDIDTSSSLSDSAEVPPTPSQSDDDADEDGVASPSQDDESNEEDDGSGNENDDPRQS